MALALTLSNEKVEVSPYGMRRFISASEKCYLSKVANYKLRKLEAKVKLDDRCNAKCNKINITEYTTHVHVSKEKFSVIGMWLFVPIITQTEIIQTIWAQ